MNRGFVRAAWGAYALNLGVILWGAVVRATGAGAGCGDHWPDCNGAVVPLEGGIKTFIEFAHRATTGLDSVAIVGLAIWGFRLFPRGHVVRRGLASTLTFLVLEAFLGALLVKWKLVVDDATPLRVVVMSLHLVNTLCLVASMALVVAWASGVGRPRWSEQGWVGALLPLGLLAMPLLGVTGAIAALGDTLFPARSLAEGFAQDFSPTAHFLLRLRVWHPIAALAVGTGLVALASAVAAVRRSPRVRDAAYALGILYVVQLGLGLANVALRAPVWMQLAHLLTADLVWTALIWLTAAALDETLEHPAVAEAHVAA